MTRSEILTNVFTQLRDAGFVYNKSDFARHLGYDQTYLSSRFTGNREISNRTFKRILEAFPQVNKVYLFTGEGDVLRTNFGPRTISQSVLYPNTGDSLVDTLLAERDALQTRLDQINQVISILYPRDMKSAS